MSRRWPKRLLITAVGVMIATHFLKKNQFKRITHTERAMITTPTVMLHGTFGTRRSLGGMIDRLCKKNNASKILEVVVEKNGQIKPLGRFEPQKLTAGAVVQLIFKNNNAPEWQQADWLKQALSLLKEKFQISEVNLLGHSAGGVASLRYLLEYGQRIDLPTVKKLVVIGAPFNGEVVSSSGRTMYDLGKDGPLQETNSYRYFSAYKQIIPKNLEVLNIFSDLGNGSRSDGLVSVASAKSLRFLIKNQVAYYQERELYGLKTQHSLLHENKKVDQLVADFLWK